MLIRVEPKDLTMVSVYFVFNKASPDPEDEAVMAYLRGHGVEPKRQADMDYEGVDCHVMSFGGCYIQPFMNEITALHRKGAEQAMLIREMDRVLAEEPTEPVRQALAAMPAERLAQLKAALVQRLHVDSSFGTDQEGYMMLALAPGQLEGEFLELAGGHGRA